MQHGSDDDVKDIIFQIQGIFGCRILNVLPSYFVTNDGAIEDSIWQGDYTKDSLHSRSQRRYTGFCSRISCCC